MVKTYLHLLDRQQVFYLAFPKPVSNDPLHDPGFSSCRQQPHQRCWQETLRGRSMWHSHSYRLLYFRSQHILWALDQADGALDIAANTTVEVKRALLFNFSSTGEKLYAFLFSILVRRVYTSKAIDLYGHSKFYSFASVLVEAPSWWGSVLPPSWWELRLASVLVEAPSCLHLADSSVLTFCGLYLGVLFLMPLFWCGLALRSNESSALVVGPQTSLLVQSSAHTA